MRAGFLVLGILTAKHFNIGIDPVSGLILGASIFLRF